MRCDSRGGRGLPRLALLHTPGAAPACAAGPGVIICALINTEVTVRNFALITLLFCLLLPGSCLAQAEAGAPGPDPQFQQHRNQHQADFDTERMQREQIRRRNKARQEEIERDTDRLLKLAKELKEYVDTSNEHVLSLDVMRKAEQIEKLAHQVREKMRHD